MTSGQGHRASERHHPALWGAAAGPTYPPGMSTHDDVRDELTRDLARLSDEIEVVHKEVVLPGWGGPMHGLHRTLYGYVMNCFAFVDLMSWYWSRTHQVAGNQTQLMIGFMKDQVGYGELASSVAVHMWRHKLMHTARPRMLVGRRTARRYRWLLHWGAEHLTRDQHMEFQQPPGDWILNIGLEFLVGDLRDAANRYLVTIEGSDKREAALVAARDVVLQPRPIDD